VYLSSQVGATGGGVRRRGCTFQGWSTCAGRGRGSVRAAAACRGAAAPGGWGGVPRATRAPHSTPGPSALHRLATPWARSPLSVRLRHELPLLGCHWVSPEGEGVHREAPPGSLGGKYCPLLEAPGGEGRGEELEGPVEVRGLVLGEAPEVAVQGFEPRCHCGGHLPVCSLLPASRPSSTPLHRTRRNGTIPNLMTGGPCALFSASDSGGPKSHREDFYGSTASLKASFFSTDATVVAWAGEQGRGKEPKAPDSANLPHLAC